MMMTQTQDKLFQIKSIKSTFYILILNTMKVIQVYKIRTHSYMLFGIEKLIAMVETPYAISLLYIL